MPQDFSGQNLRGRSFKGQNLEGANFSYADIRGANFTGANLTGANFSHTKAGLSYFSIISLFIFLLILSLVAGFISASTGALIGDLFSINFLFGFVALNILPSIIIVSFWPKLGIIITAILLTIIIFCLIFISAFLPDNLSGGMIRSYSQNIGFIIISYIIGTVDIVLALAITRVIALPTGITLTGFTVFISAVLGILLGVQSEESAYFTAGLIAIVSITFGIYVSGQAIAGNEKYSLVRSLAVRVVAQGDTSFRNANLTDANFTNASFKSTDFRGAILIRTCFQQVKMLDRVCPGTTYLQYANLWQVLSTGQGQEKNFDRLDLRGVNFQKAYLTDASFIAADLSGASFQDADLSRAKLVQAQLNGTNLTGATLTGTYIQDWGITTDTKFDGVRCEYVYMRLPTKENPDPLRKPDNNKEVFADGEFGDFIKPIFDTLDLYHNQDVDPRAIAISFKQLAENHPDAELEIVAMEKRGQDKFLLRAKTAVTADKSELSAEYFDTYNEIKALPEREIKLLLEEKDSRIRSLETMVMTALERPSFYSNIQVEEVGTMTNTPGGFSVGGSVGGNANNVQGDGNSVVQGDTTMAGDRNINTGGGNYNERIERDYIQGNYYAAGQPQSLAQAAAEIQVLLKQLEQTYPTTSTSQQMVVAAEAINRIESNPLLKERVINAVKEGGLAAFEKAIDNPAGAFIVGAIKGWQEVEAED